MNEKVSNELFDVAFLWSLLLVNAEEVANDYMEVASLGVTELLEEYSIHFSGIESVLLYKDRFTLTDCEGNSLMLPHTLHPSTYMLACHTLEKTKRIYKIVYEMLQPNVSQETQQAQIELLRTLFVEVN